MGDVLIVKISDNVVETDLRLEKRGRIEVAVKSSGLTNAKIARMLKVSDQAVSRWLRTGAIKDVNLKKLATAIGASYNWLLMGEDEHNAHEYKHNMGLHTLVEKLDWNDASVVKLFAENLYEIAAINE